MIDMKGKVAVILGVANKRSIAYAIAEKLAAAGATLVLSYQSDRLKKASEELLESLGQTNTGLLVECDVASDEAVASAFAQIQTKFPEIHTLVHSVGFAPNIKNAVINTARADFAVANDISVYSLIAIAHAALPMMPEGSSILTLTYYGADKVFPNYNIMGICKAGLEATVRYLAYELGPKKIRVNAISAGPINTLAARGIGDFATILDTVTTRAPLHRNIEQDEVGNAALFLTSDLASGITGEITFVDCGFNITGI